MVTNIKQKAYWLGGICLVLLFCNAYFQIFVFHPFAQNSFEKDSDVVRIMTFNINSVDSLPIKADRRNKILKIIADAKPDILCLQELSIERYPEFRQDLDNIFGCNSLELESIDKLHYYIYSRYPYANYRKYNNLGVVDTIGFTEENYHELDRYNNDHMPIYSADIKLPNEKRITIMSCHLRSSAYTTARRSMKDDDNWLSGLPSYIDNYNIGKRIRDAQATFLRQKIDSVGKTDSYVFVVGDLNDFCRSTCIKTIQGNDLFDAWWSGGNGFGFTYAGWNLRLRLDHILYPKDFTLSNVYVVDSDVSDHRALIADFKLNNN